jgi:hypothetical protein
MTEAAESSELNAVGCSTGAESDRRMLLISLNSVFSAGRHSPVSRTARAEADWRFSMSFELFGIGF